MRSLLFVILCTALVGSCSRRATEAARPQSTSTTAPAAAPTSPRTPGARPTVMENPKVGQSIERAQTASEESATGDRGARAAEQITDTRMMAREGASPEQRSRPASEQPSGATTPGSMTTTGAPVGQEAVPAQLLFELRKPVCRGTCPTYRFAVLDDGSVRYTGQENVAWLGEHTFRPGDLGHARLLAAFQQFMATNPKTMYPDISRLPADMQPTILEYPATDGQIGAIRVYEGAPAEFTALLELAEQVIEAGGK